MNGARAPLSVIVPTGNRVDVIEGCLGNVRWADEIVVVDSFSTDGSFEIATKHADKVVRHEYSSSALQKNWIIHQAAHDWVLFVDTDERVPIKLRQEIEAALRSPDPFIGYRIPRLNLVLGEPVKNAGYYPDYQIRLFRRDMGRYELRHVHAHVLLDGPCGTMRSPLVHYTHRSIDQTIRNLLLQMTTWEAQERHKVSSASDAVPSRGLLRNTILRPFLAFLLRYGWKGGWKDGYRGLTVSMLWSMYVALTYMKVWERNLSLPEGWWDEDWKNRTVDANKNAQHSLRS